MTMFFDHCATPIGKLLLIVDEAGRLTNIEFVQRGRPLPDAEQSPDRCAHVATQLREYFDGSRLEFEIDCAPSGTEFQRRAWRALQAIPFGQTRSYAQQAQSIDSPRAVRAVGGANRSNPIPIVVPCHRVIGKNGDLTGYSGNLPAKRFLLEHEARVLARRNEARP